MARINTQPRTKQFDERTITRHQDKFGTGMVNDPPASTIPTNAVWKLVDYLDKKNRLDCRPGSIAYNTTTIPYWNLTLQYSGSSVSSYNTFKFKSSDVGLYIYFKDTLQRSQITSLVSPVNGESYDVNITPSVAAHGGPAPAELQRLISGVYYHVSSRATETTFDINGSYYHKDAKKIVLVLGGAFKVGDPTTEQKVFESTDLSMDTWVEVQNTSYDKLSNSICMVDEFNQWCFIYNDNGVYKFDASIATPKMFKCNSAIPTNRIADVSQTDARPYGYRYLYSMVRLSGAGVRNRQTSGIVIEQESGTTAIDKNGKDYGEVFNTYAVGLDQTNQNYFGGLVLAPYTDVTSTLPSWNTVANGAFRITVNGTTSSNILCDFTAASSLDEVAYIISVGLQTAFPTIDISCEYVVIETSPHFQIINKTPNTTTSAMLAPFPSVGLTDISGVSGSPWTYLSLGWGGRQVTKIVNKPSTIGTLSAPTEASGNKAQHWTHYGVYRTLDVGPNGTDVLQGVGNNPELYVWVDDIPVYKESRVVVLASAKSSITWRSGDKFYQSDVGSKFRFYSSDNIGRTATITEVNAAGTIAYTVDSLNSTGFPYDEPITLGVSPSRFSNEGFTNGVSYSGFGGITYVSSDIGKMVHFQDGSYNFIVSVLDGVATIDDLTKTMGGSWIDVEPRSYQDSTFDDDLRTRISSYSLGARFWTPVMNANMGKVTPGRMFVCNVNGTQIDYSQMPSGYEYLVGYHNPAYQYAIVKDKIRKIREYPDSVIVYCAHSTHSLITSTSNSVTIPEVGESVDVLAGQNIVDATIGASCDGAICQIDQMRDLVITNEPQIRIFDGQKYSDSLSKDRINLILKGLKSSFCSLYNKQRGFIFWGIDSSGIAINSSFNLGFGADDGTGFSENSTSFPVCSTTNRGLLQIIDANDKVRSLVLDTTTRLWYDIASVDGYPSSGMFEAWQDKMGCATTGFSISASSGLVGITLSGWERYFSDGDYVWFDSVGGMTTLNRVKLLVTKVSSSVFTVPLVFTSQPTWTSGGFVMKAGTDLSPEVWFGEDRGNYEHYYIENIESHTYLRPKNEDNRNTNGYDSEGYPIGFSANLNVFVDGEHSVPAATVTGLPIHGTISLDKTVQGNRIQKVLSFNMSGACIVGRQDYYQAKDLLDAPEDRELTEDAIQLVISNPSLWYSRGVTNLNRCDGTYLQSINPFLNGTGPDGVVGSAFYLPSPDGIDFGIIQPSTGTVMFWCDDTGVPSLVCDDIDCGYANSIFTPPEIDCGHAVFVLTQTIDLNNSSTVSHTPIAYASIGNWKLYYYISPSVFTTLRINPSGASCYLFDVRIINSTLTQQMIKYYFDNLNKDNGSVFLPMI